MNNDILAYIYDFLSVFMSRSRHEVRRVIVFGSVLTNDFGEESDIDLFIDVPDDEAAVQTVFDRSLDEFETASERKWSLQGIGHPIKAIVGDLESPDWEGLRREVTSNGVVLFDRYKELPGKLRHIMMFSYKLNGLVSREKVAFVRSLHGYSSKKGGKTYRHPGLLEKLGGMKINRGVVIVPIERSNEAYAFFRRKGIELRVEEVWADM